MPRLTRVVPVPVSADEWAEVSAADGVPVVSVVLTMSCFLVVV
jgi:hypothetical protein